MTALFLITMSAIVTTAELPASGVVSDLDDTIKMTNVMNLPFMIWNGIASHKIFAGMTELLGEMRKNEDGSKKSLLVISGSPEQLRHTIEETLTSNQISDFEVALKNWGAKQDVMTYKLGVLNAKVSSPSILLGDDTEKDPEIYAEFRTKKPELVREVYIHRLKGRVLSPDLPVKTWLTPFDIAYQEFQAGRMSESSVLVVAKAIQATKSTEFGRIVPLYGSFGCADESSRPCGQTSNPAVEAACQQIKARVKSICDLWKRERMKMQRFFEQPTSVPTRNCRF